MDEQETKISLGAKIIVEDRSGDKSTFTLVVPEQIDLSKNRISVNSPIGKALLNRKAGENIITRIPAG